MPTLKQHLLSLPFYVLPHHAISALMFRIARIRVRAIKNLAIRIYTALNRVNMDEAVEPDRFAYASLNAFFTRALKPECRPFAGDASTWLCPVDGAVSQAGEIHNGRIFQAKGHDYSLFELLGGDEQHAVDFDNGMFATLYLSPRDYHRIHMPLAGNLVRMLHVPGRLFSVAEHTVNCIPGLFARNERVVCFFDTASGPLAMVLVGAINVSAIETVWHGLVADGGGIRRYDYRPGDVSLQRGEEMGRFNLGSTVIVLAPPGFQCDDAMTPGAAVRLGQALGRQINEDTERR
jgi:phosphatidylserine decarboxylase